jgi:perosamine synthetase
MYPRKRLDLNTWTFLRFIGFLCSRREKSARKTLQSLFGTEHRHVLPMLSVRSGFDCLLQALELPKGSKVMLSAITIPDMARIIEEHGLVPVPVDIDVETFEPNLEDAERKIDGNTRVFLFAHLFGSVSDITRLSGFCKKHNMLLIEDAAQAFVGPDYLGHSESDVVMWSFGPIKTATALAGGIMAVHARHMAIADKMERIASTWPLYSRVEHAKRIAKFALQHVLTNTALFTLFVYTCRFFKRDYDSFISRFTKSFPREKLFQQIRQKVSTPVIVSMAWRLSTYQLWKIERREEGGMRTLHKFALRNQIPGIKSIRHTFWLFAVMSNQSDSLVKKFRENGIDATKLSTSLSCIGAHAKVDTPSAYRMIQSVFYLPHSYANSSRMNRQVKRVFTQCEDALFEEQTEHRRMFQSYPSSFVTPKNRNEFVHTIRLLISGKSGFVVSGRMKSHGGHTVCNGHTHVSCSLLNSIIHFDEKKCEITVESGVLWREILRFLDKKGYSPLAMQSSNDFSVGGSIAGGIHGRNIHAAHISEAVKEIEYIDMYSGEICKTIPGEHAFKELVGGQGWSGVILSAAIKVVPNVNFLAEVKIVPTKDVPQFIGELKKYGKEVFFMGRGVFNVDYTFPNIIANVWKEKNSVVSTANELDDRERNVMRDKVIFRLSLVSHWLLCLRNRLEYFLSLQMNKKEFSRNSLMCPPVTPLKFLLHKGVRNREHAQEFFIPVDAFEAFSTKLAEHIRMHNIRVAGMTIRYLKENRDFYLSPNKTSDAISVMCYLQTKNTFGDFSKTISFVQAATRSAIALGGAPFLSYAFWQDQRELLKIYPQLAKIAVDSPIASRYLVQLRSKLDEE